MNQLRIGGGNIQPAAPDPMQLNFQILTERSTLAVAPTEQDRHTTVFVACIPKGIDDLFIENLLLVLLFYYLISPDMRKGEELEACH